MQRLLTVIIYLILLIAALEAVNIGLRIGNLLAQAQSSAQPSIRWRI